MRSNSRPIPLSTTLQRRAWILDVGHGNSTVVEAPGYVSVIDGGRGDTLLQFLADRGISRVDTVIVSHADADHFGGISLLLASSAFEVGEVFVNPDGRGTAIWLDFYSIMRDAKQRGTKFHLEVSDATPHELRSDGIRLEVLGPSQERLYRTVGGRAADGKRLTPNAMSAVVRVWADDSPRLLLAGDIDEAGLAGLLGRSTGIRAHALVYPHHGGLPGTSDPADFAESLATAVGAELVIFSIGRGRYGTPRPENVAAALRGAGGVHIACTQLSERCAADIPTVRSDLHAGIARGNHENVCCAGTIEISLEPKRAYAPDRATHLAFIERNAPTALCQGRGAPATR